MPSEPSPAMSLMLCRVLAALSLQVAGKPRVCSSCACGGWAVPLLLWAPIKVLVVAVLKQSPGSLPCHQPVPRQPRGCEGRGEQSHVLCLEALIERALRFLFFRSIEI